MCISAADSSFVGVEDVVLGVGLSYLWAATIFTYSEIHEDRSFPLRTAGIIPGLMLSYIEFALLTQRFKSRLSFNTRKLSDY